VDELIQQAGLPHAGLPHRGHELTVPSAGACQRLRQHRDLRLPSDKARQAARHPCLQATTDCRGADQLEDLHRLGQSLHRSWAKRVDLHQALDQPQGRGRQQDTTRRGQLFHARRQVHRLSDRRVVHVQVIVDAAHHHLAGIEPHPKVHGQAMRAPHLVTVAVQRGLDVERRIAGPHGVVLVGQRRPEQGHNAVAHHLVDGAFILVDGRHHAFEHRVENCTSLLGVAVGEQLHGAFQVGEEHRDLLPLAFEGGFGYQDFLDEVGWCVCLG
jgi:hypothetical protein